MYLCGNLKTIYHEKDRQRNPFRLGREAHAARQGLVEGHAAERESLIRRMKAAGLSADLIETITNG